MMRFFRLIKAYWRGFVGGPDFNRCVSFRFILERKQLTIKIPDSNVAAAPSTPDINVPHTSNLWFEEHAEETYRQHKFVHMITKIWMYMPPIVIFPSSEYGMLSCQLRIKQINHINVLETQALANFVTQACDDYNNGPDGINTRLREEVTERFNRSSVIWTQEEKEEEIERELVEYIKFQGEQPLAPATLKHFNQLTWVFYRETQNKRLTHHDYYCLPLSEHSLLEVKFSHRVDLNHKHKKWSQHALASQEQIMASIYLEDLAITQDPAIKHNSEPA